MRLSYLYLILLICQCEVLGQNDSSSRSYLLEQLRAGDALLETEPVDAALHYDQALRVAQDLNEPLILADCYASLGEACFLVGDHDRALDYQFKAFEIYTSIDDKDKAARLLSDIGSTYYFSRAGDLNKAKSYYEKAAAWYAEQGDDAQSAMNTNYAAYIEWALGNKESALESHLQAYKKFQEIGDQTGMATALSDVGFTLNSLERYEEALEYSQRALELEQAGGNALMQVPTINNIGIAYLGLGDLKQALEYSLRSFNMAKERGLMLRESEAAETLHRIYAQMGEYEKAYALLARHKFLNDQVAISNQAKNILESDMAREFREREQLLAFESEKEQALARERLRGQKRRNLTLWVMLVLVLALVVTLLRGMREKQRTNQILSDQKKELQGKHEELLESMRRLKATQSEMIRMEKDASLGVLTAGAAHEINNPMNYIRGAVYAIEDELEDDGQVAEETLTEMLGHIKGGVERTAKIIDGLYAFSRQSGDYKFEQIDLNAELEGIVKAFEHKHSAAIRFDAPTAGVHYLVLADRHALKQILENLLGNACDAIQSGGSVWVSVVHEPPDQVLVRVEDDGSGIREDDLNRVYDPFFTTKLAGQGVGLGLTFVHKLVSDLGGKVTLSSTIDVGTVAACRFPQFKADAT